MAFIITFVKNTIKNLKNKLIIMINLCHILILRLKIKLIKVLVKKLNKIKTAFVTFFQSSQMQWDHRQLLMELGLIIGLKKKIFQISHLKK